MTCIRCLLLFTVLAFLWPYQIPADDFHFHSTLSQQCHLVASDSSMAFGNIKIEGQMLILRIHEQVFRVFGSSCCHSSLETLLVKSQIRRYIEAGSLPYRK